MGFVNKLWRKLTHTKALDQSSGEMETIFFGCIYRVIYALGLSSLDRDTGYLIYSTIIKLIIVNIVVCEMWYGFTVASGLDEVASTINVILMQLIAMYRYKKMSENKEFYKILATTMESPYFDISTEKRRKLVNEWAQRTEYYLKLLLHFGHCTLTTWFTYPLLDDIVHNHIIGVRMPFNDDSPARFAVAYLFVCVSFGIISHFVMLTNCNLQAHLIHILCQYTVLADCFEDLLFDCSIGFEDMSKDELFSNKDFQKIYTKRLGDLVEQHKFVLSHTMKLGSILSAPMLGQLAASGTLICFIGYQTANELY